MDISKVVIPAAGLGTRFLPLTKAIPKEMIPLLNKPALQWIIEEAIASDLKHFIMITSRGKHAIADYFDTDFTLEQQLKDQHKQQLIEEVDRTVHAGTFTYVRQHEPLGLGHAVMQARHLIGKEYFGVCLPDDILIGTQPGLAQLIRLARQERSTIIAVQEVPMSCVSNYGVVGIKKTITTNLFQVSELIEKPTQTDAPSNLAIIGRYVLSHKIFDALEYLSMHTPEGELQLTDAIQHMMKNAEKVYAYKIQGTRYDLGTTIGWLKAIIGTGLQHPQYGPALREFLADYDGIDSFMFNSTKAIEHQTP